MVANQPKDWRKLCEAASKEEDPQKLLELVSEINEVLEERDRNRSCLFGARDIAFPNPQQKSVRPETVAE